MTVNYRSWARSFMAPRERFLPGLGARLYRRPHLFSAVLVALRRAPPGRVRAAVFRNVSKPLVSRTNARLEVPVAGGSTMVVETADLIGRVLAISGIWEPQVTAAFRAVLSGGDVCIDVGANIGYFSLLASKLVGSEGHVYALEPSPVVYAELCSNLELNRAANVTALCVAAGDREATAVLHEGHGRNRGSASLRATDPDPNDETRLSSVRVRPLDPLVPAAEVRRVRLVKIDVEGYELEVLRGLEGLFERGGRPAIIVELTPEWGGGEAAAYLASFCARHELKPHRLARQRLLAGTGNVRHAPSEIGSISTEQQELLLVPQ